MGKNPRKSMSFTRQCEENCQAIIAEVKSRNKLNNEGMAKMMGLACGTFNNRRGNPGDFRLKDLWRLYQSSGIPGEKMKTILIGGEDENV